MIVYLITYDLRAPGRDYRSLIAAIRALGPCIRPLESTWYVTSNASAAAIRDALLKHIDRNDGLMVQRCAAEAAWHGLTNSDAATLRSWITMAR